MSLHDQAQDLLAAYGRIAGQPHLRFEAHGCARLVFDDRLTVDLEVDDRASCVQVVGVLGPVPAAGREALYRALLEANHLGTATRGATLAIDAANNEVLLSRQVNLQQVSSGMAFGDLLNAFADTLEHWQQRFGSGQFGAADAEKAPLPLGLRA
jgi:hypothetical protein